MKRVLSKCLAHLSALIVFFLALPYDSQAASSAFTLDSNSKPQLVGEFTDYIEDKTGTLTLEDIMRVDANESSSEQGALFWSKSGQHGISEGFTRSVYWFRFSVDNISQEQIDWNLEFEYPLLDKINFFYPVQDDSYEMITQGDRLPFSAREIDYRNVVIPLTADVAQTYTYYFRVETVSAMNVSLKVWPSDTLYEAVDRLKMLLGIVYGIVLLALITSTVNAIFLKDYMYLWLSVGLVGLLMYMNGIKGITYQYLWPNSLWWQEVNIPFFMNISFAFALQYCRLFTDLKRYAPRFDKLFKVTIYAITTLSAASLFVSYEIIILISTVSVTFNALLCFAAGVVAWHNNNSSSHYYVAGWFVLIVGVISFSLTTIGIFPKNNLTDWCQEVGFVFMVIFMTISQLDRFLQVNHQHEEEQAIALDALTQAEKKYRSLFENAIEGIFQIDKQGSLLNSNKAFEEIANESDKPLQNAETLPFSLGFLSETESQKLKTVLATRENISSYESSFVDQNNQTRWIAFSIQKIMLKDGENYHYEGSVSEITESKMREKAEKQRRMADASTEAKSLFLANMSHEIRTPMNAIIGFTDLATAHNTDNKLADFIRKIKIASANLLNTINDILDFSKMEAGKLDIEYVPFKLKQMTDKLQNTLSVDAEKKALDLVIDIDPDIPKQLIGDELRIRQFLVNLTKNAIKYTDQGEVRVELDLVELDKQHGSVVLEGRVIDTGVGISQTRQETLFSSFTQVDDSMEAKASGTGLGLSISKQLIEMMGGEISVSSTEGKGSCFEFCLSCRVESRDIKRSSTSPTSITKEPNDSTTNKDPSREIKLTEGIKVLLVDDIEINRELAREILTKYKVRTSMAIDGKQAIEKARKGNFDLILMDMEMPVIDGCEATKQIRKFDSNTPIIAMTANTLVEDKQRCSDAGMNGFITKPFNDTELIELIYSQVNNKKEEQLSPNIENTKDTNNIEDTFSTVSPPDLKSINFTEGLNRCQGNRKLYVKLLRDFSKNYHEVGIQLEAMFKSKQLDEYARTAHTLKGVAANLGIQHIPDIAKQLENIKTLDEEGLTSTMLELANAMNDLLSEITQLLESEPELQDTQAENKFDTRELGEKLKLLESMITEQKMEAYDQAVLYLKCWPIEEQITQIESLVSALDLFEFEQASQTLNLLQSRVE